MPRNDFVCPGCGARHEYQLPFRARPVCACGYLMWWSPPRVVMDAYEPFQAFEIDAPQGRVRIDSLAKLRAVERESEQRARNGEGQPLIWRDYAQNRSNRDVHTLTSDVTKPMDGYAGEDAGPVGVQPLAVRRGREVTRRHGSL